MKIQNNSTCKLSEKLNNDQLDKITGGIEGSIDASIWYGNTTGAGAAVVFRLPIG
jgi:hypothetical protein